MNVPTFNENSIAWINYEHQGEERFTRWKEVFDIIDLDKYIKGTPNELDKIEYQNLAAIDYSLKKYLNVRRMQFLKLKIKYLKEEEVNYVTNYVKKVETSIEKELREALSLVLETYIKDCEIILKGLKSKENLNLREYIQVDYNIS